MKISMVSENHWVSATSNHTTLRLTEITFVPILRFEMKLYIWICMSLCIAALLLTLRLVSELQRVKQNRKIAGDA